jgi:hypothetical protein
MPKSPDARSLLDAHPVCTKFMACLLDHALHANRQSRKHESGWKMTSVSESNPLLAIQRGEEGESGEK